MQNEGDKLLRDDFPNMVKIFLLPLECVSNDEDLH